jgi:predicted nucleotidyltransferase
MIDRNILIELTEKRIEDCSTDILNITDIRIAGSYCYNFHKKESDLDVVIVGKLVNPLRHIKSFGYTIYNKKHIAFIFIDIDFTTPNWGKYTLPHLSLLTNNLFFYDKLSILEYMKHCSLYKKDYYIDRDYTDYYGSNINLRKELEVILI